MLKTGLFENCGESVNMGTVISDVCCFPWKLLCHYFFTQRHSLTNKIFLCQMFWRWWLALLDVNNFQNYKTRFMNDFKHHMMLINWWRTSAFLNNMAVNNDDVHVQLFIYSCWQLLPLFFFYNSFPFSCPFYITLLPLSLPLCTGW